jgi:hypothetical protein
LTPQQSSQQWRSNAQSSGQNTEPIRHTNEVTFARQRWQSVAFNYYIPKTTMPSWSTPIVGYYTFEPIPILNSIATDSKVEHN